MPTLEYNDLPPDLRRVHWKVDKVEENLIKESSERKENDKIIFDKFDKMNNMIICQLCAAVLTLVVVIMMFISK